MPRLPLLVGILSVGGKQKLPVIFRSLFKGLEMIVGGGAQKIGGRVFRQEAGASVQRLDGEGKILIFRSRNGELSVGLSEAGLDLYRVEQLTLGVGELALVEQYFSELIALAGIVGIAVEQQLVGSLCLGVISGSDVQLCHFAQCGWIIGRELAASFQFRQGFLQAVLRGQHASELE